MCPQPKRVCQPPPNVHVMNTGHLPSTNLSLMTRCLSFLFMVFRTATSDSNFLKYYKRSFISFDIAEVFGPILVSLLKNNCISSCLLSLSSTASVCVQVISTIRYNLMKNKIIVLLTRPFAGKIIAFNFFPYASALCSVQSNIPNTTMFLFLENQM